MTNPNPYQIAQDVTTQLRRAIDTMQHVTEDINCTIQRLQEMKAEAFTEIELTNGEIKAGDTIHWDDGTSLIISEGSYCTGNNITWLLTEPTQITKVTRRVPSPACPDIPADKIPVDRAQYERMQGFVGRTYNLFPSNEYYSYVDAVSFVRNMRVVLVAYSRGETP